jgi:autotransporter-associated beta strand protein
VFADQSTLGTAQIEIFGNGSLDISLHAAPGMTINSIKGDGSVFLGANKLTVGSDNGDTAFSCSIQDGGRGGGVGGSLTKIGMGTLDLTGANTYTGDTTVTGDGVLTVDGSITTNVINNGRLSPGDALGVLTVVHNYTQTQYATLMILIVDNHLRRSKSSAA